MTYGDLLDQAAHDAGDSDGEYRTNARRWLNLARSYIADKAQWATAMYVGAPLYTSASTTSGVYTLSSGIERIYGDLLYDETNNTIIRYESYSVLRGMDPDKSVTSTPAYWADAGSDDDGYVRIFLWPVPSASYLITYPAVRRLYDVGEAQESLTMDTYFGPVLSWAATFAAGIRYFQDLNNNEDATQIFAQKASFDKLIDSRKKNNGVSPHAGLVLDNVRSSGHVAAGRFDPSHYNNRG